MSDLCIWACTFALGKTLWICFKVILLVDFFWFSLVFPLDFLPWWNIFFSTKKTPITLKPRLGTVQPAIFRSDRPVEEEKEKPKLSCLDRPTTSKGGVGWVVQNNYLWWKDRALYGLWLILRGTLINHAVWLNVPRFLVHLRCKLMGGSLWVGGAYCEEHKMTIYYFYCVTSRYAKICNWLGVEQ